MNNTTRPLAPTEVAALLESMRSAVGAEIAAMSDEVLAWHPAPGEWCAKECLGHMLEAERRGFNGRIRKILSESDPELPGWDQQAVERERNDCQRAVNELLAEFNTLRTDSVELVKNLKTTELQRGGTHEKVGHVRVADLIQEWVHHDRNHFRQLQANLQAYVWPSMGNCQKFAGE
jgi:hypothetical protein